MRLRPEQVDKEVQRSLLPVYLVTGDEPLIVQEVMDSLRSACQAAGYSERKVLNVDRQFNWNTLNEEANSLSLFAEQKLTELRLGSSKPGKPGSKALTDYCTNLPEDSILLIECAKLDAASLKSKWATQLDKAGAIIQVWPISLNEMPKWLGQRARKMGLMLDQDAIHLLCDRLEGNLLAAQQELEKLKLLFDGQTITADAVLESVSDSSKYDIFDLTDACINGKTELVIKICNNLRSEGSEPTVALWALGKEVRILLALAIAEQQGLPGQQVFKQYRVISRRQAGLSLAAKRLGRARLMELLKQCKQVDDLIKGVEKGIQPWDILLDISVSLSGKQIF